MKLVIDRQKWLRGFSDLDISYLLNDEDKMCCLGFLSLEFGQNIDEIRLIAKPNCIVNPKKQWEDFNLINLNSFDNTKICYDLMRINDDTCISDLEREELLTEKFKSINIDVVFIN